MSRVARCAAAIAAALASTAGAQELSCEERVGRLELGRDGAPREDRLGAPVLVRPGAVLELRSYPALIGIAVEVRAAPAGGPVVVVAASSPVLDRILRVEGALLETPLALPAGATRSRTVAVAIESYEECLRWAGEDDGAGSCAGASADLRVVVAHDRGSAECRARIVCHVPGAAR